MMYVCSEYSILFNISHWDVAFHISLFFLDHVNRLAIDAKYWKQIPNSVVANFAQASNLVFINPPFIWNQFWLNSVNFLASNAIEKRWNYFQLLYCIFLSTFVRWSTLMVVEIFQVEIKISQICYILDANWPIPRYSKIKATYHSVDGPTQLIC